ncbi:hypothetical protein [Nocardia mexicana]|uniref:Uncharacterized protein n=1 Tax=Nocardia mexicana TaxID=279262 RepID=A0A370GJZ2_9NOCA|nr:hypothetical protein [Nocardia mexicana]RDI43579.1 hypothetical protein DFR68_12046 [Nocardia mexicana]
MSDFVPPNPAGAPLSEQQAETLRELHAHASATTTLLGVVASEPWHEPVAVAQDLTLRALTEARVDTEQHARALGVPERTVALAWLAGHRQQDWPAADPGGLDAELQRLAWQGLVANTDRLLDMLAVETADINRVDVGRPDPDAVDQYHRNAIALARQIFATGDLLEVGNADWTRLLHIDESQQTGPYRDVDAETLRARWVAYTDPNIAVDARATVDLLTQLRDRGRAWQPTPDSTSGAAETELDVTAGNRQTQTAIDTALSGTDPSWQPHTTVTAFPEPGTRPSTDPGVDP